MKIDYEYKVQAIDVDGTAIVEYTSLRLGSITRTFLIPYDRTEEQIRRKIVEMFPFDLFYSRRLELQADLAKTIDGLVRGKMTVDFDDHFYSIQEMSSEATGP